MKYAINIGDLSTERILAMVFSDVLKSKVIVNAEPKMVDGMAVLIDCEEERAKAIIETIRLKKAKNELRCYESKTGQSWKRI